MPKKKPIKKNTKMTMQKKKMQEQNSYVKEKKQHINQDGSNTFSSKTKLAFQLW